MTIEMSRQKHLIDSHRDLSSSMIGCTLDDSGNLINGRTLDRRFLPGIDITRSWETILLKSPGGKFHIFFLYGRVITRLLFAD
jgi:hypothetical protein